VWQPAILIASRTLPDINAGIMISADREYNQGVTSRIVEEMFWHTGGLLATVFLNNGIEAINPEDINLRRIAQIKNFRGKA
jgi:hypothetical protein